MSPMDEATRELIHRTIDHEADAAEQGRLQAILAADPQARSEWEETTSLVRLFAKVGLVEPPPGWKEQLEVRLSRLGRPEAFSGQSSARPSRVGWGLAELRQRLSMRTAFVFAAGAVAGIAVFAALSLVPQLVDESLAPGSIVASGHRGRESSRSHRLGEFGVDLPTGRVVLRSSVEQGATQVEVEAGAEGELTLDLEFDPRVLRVRAVEQEATGAARIVVDPGHVQIEQHAPNHYGLRFESAGANVISGPTGSVEIRIQVRTPEDVQEGSLPASPAAAGS